MARIDSFLELVVEQHASDLHFHAGNPPFIRHHGELVNLPFRALSEMETRRFLYEILSQEQREKFESNLEIDTMYALPGLARFRVNMFQQTAGMGAVFRIVPNKLPTLDELECPPSVRRLIELQNGLVLIAGPTGSGKTTTLAALVNEINLRQKRHIITIEDPIEFLHTPALSVVTQRQVGIHVPSFADALRSALREAPDVIVVGEMRDIETISLAIAAAETGALVFGTLHTNSAARSIDRIIDALPEEGREQARGVLSVLLRGVIAQQLCKSADGEGRRGVLEILLQNFAISHMIREGKTFQIDSYLQSVNPEETGMQSMDICIVRSIRDGRIDPQEGLRLAQNVDLVKRAAAAVQEEA